MRLTPGSRQRVNKVTSPGDRCGFVAERLTVYADRIYFC